ncbi:glycoside hydrolase family 19 protein, partial [Aggregatibacter actinomycetemcomitans]
TRIADLGIGLKGEGFDSERAAYYFHPLGMIGFLQQKIQNKCKHCGKSLILNKDFLRKICSPGVSEVFLDALVLASQNLFGKYKVDSCRQIIHLLAQGKQETTDFTAFRESLNYTRKSFTAERLYRLSPTVINNGFIRKGLGHYTREQKLEYIDKNLLGNDKAYGEHCYGVAKYPNNDYRGRGFIHLTHYETYEKCSKYIPFNIEKNPTLLETNYTAAIESALWFWNIYNKIGNIADSDNKDLSNDNVMRELTKIVNRGLDGYANRVSYKSNIKRIFFEIYGECK